MWAKKGPHIAGRIPAFEETQEGARSRPGIYNKSLRRMTTNDSRSWLPRRWRSPAIGDALDLLADVLGRAARAARIAGQQCERDYDALTTK